jgi:hypothetical protein
MIFFSLYVKRNRHNLTDHLVNKIKVNDQEVQQT